MKSSTMRASELIRLDEVVVVVDVEVEAELAKLLDEVLEELPLSMSEKVTIGLESSWCRADSRTLERILETR